jgi:hypothetical protein
MLPQNEDHCHPTRAPRLRLAAMRRERCRRQLHRAFNDFFTSSLPDVEASRSTRCYGRCLRRTAWLTHDVPACGASIGDRMRIRFVLGLILVLSISSSTFAQDRKALRAAGLVDTVAQNTLTVALPGAQKISVAVDENTKVVGKGLGTKTRNMKDDGKAPAIADLVKASDNVVVTYVDEGGGKLRATEINVRQSAK